MSDDYIRKIDAVNACYDGYDIDDNINDAVESIKSLKSADVAPVVHAYWEGEETDCNIKCHKCGKAFKDYIITQDYADLSEYPNFCPNCGAKMDREE